jgi:hypothetical protein
VLVLWSIIAILWGHGSHKIAASQARGVPAPSRDAKALPVYGPLGMSPLENTIVRPMPGPHPRQEMIVQPPYLPAVLHSVPTTGNAQPMMTKQYQYNFPPEGKQYQYNFPAAGEVQLTIADGRTFRVHIPPENEIPAAGEGQPMMMKQYQYNFPPDGQNAQWPASGSSNIYKNLMAVQPEEYNASPLANSQYAMMQSQPNMGSSSGGSGSSGYVYSYSSSSSSTTTTDVANSNATTADAEEPPPPPVPVPPPLAGASYNTKVYYYDPSQAVSANGQMKMPKVVYDAQGNAIALSDLQASEIVVEPPLGMIHHNISNATIINITYSHPNVESSRHDRARTMSLGDLPALSDVAWGASTSTDQSIIVATVGVMALLVGAVSARKLRSRSILSACIENETLEDEIAYDTAYTIPSDSYNTFSQGWKGDLEKFDV